MKEDHPTSSEQDTKELQSVTIRFAGDSGDGIQVTGTHFGIESALAGNDISTFPNYPSEIRAPAGTLAGVSGFQINFGCDEINTPGDSLDVLVAFNPAALRANIDDVRSGGIVILNKDAFTQDNLQKAGYQNNPCDNYHLSASYRVFVVPISTLTKTALTGTNLTPREIERCKNFFALGITLWMFHRPKESTLNWIQDKFSHRPELIKANTLALEAGMVYAGEREIFSVTYVIKPASLKPGTYRTVSGTTATAYGLIAASQNSGLPLFYGAYPITPASDILHELAQHRHLDVTTFQAEDEIAAICSSLGAAFTGQLAVTGTSGPGLSLKTEALGLAVMTELPLVVIDVQRAGPSTGMPTKTEQADLFQALWGRSGEAPLCVIAASSPKTSFTMAYEACRIALKYMTPVILLSEGYIVNTSAPWKLPDPKDLPKITFHQTTEPNTDDGIFLPYKRDPETLARPWAVPGTPELMHRIGGLEKENETGAVCYEPENHDLMCRLRKEKIARIANEIAPLTIDGEKKGDLLVIGWGSTQGAIKDAVRSARAEGLSVSRIHLFHLNPLPQDLGKIMSAFKNILIPEVNFGHLRTVLRDKFLLDIKGLNRVTGTPIKVAEIEQAIKDTLKAR